MDKKIDITPPMGIYETFKNYNYKTGSALAEFLDNSIESFRANWKTIENSPEKNIIIIFDNHNKEMYVYDTAFGIHEKDYERVLKLKAVPQNTLGLNEFGMGLKTAAFWFGKNLEVISRCRSNENLDFQNGVKLCLTQTNIKEGQSHIYAERFDARNSQWKLKYGTVVKISGVDRDLSNSIAKKCSSLISRQYKKDIRNKGIKIYFYTKEQSEDKFLDINYWSINNKKKYQNKESLLDGKFLEYPKEKILVYKNEKMQKKVNFEVSHKDIILKVHGELFIRKKGSRFEAGIDLFRRDRIIINKCTDFIPEQSSFEYQRINGFLNLDNFTVTQAKDNFDWEGELFNKVYEEFHKLTEVQELISFARKLRIRSENSQKNIEKKIAKFTREKLFHDPNVETFNLKKIKDFANENNLKYSKTDTMHKIRTNQGEKIIYSRLENKSFKSWMKIEKSKNVWLVRLDVNHIFFSPFNNLKNSSNSAYFISKLREFAIYWAYSEIQSEESREGVSQFRKRFADLIEKNRDFSND